MRTPGRGSVVGRPSSISYWDAKPSLDGFVVDRPNTSALRHVEDGARLGGERASALPSWSRMPHSDIAVLGVDRSCLDARSRHP